MSPRVQQANYGDNLQREREYVGPCKGRSCTDVLCLLLFVVAMIAWGVIGKYAYVYGDPNRLLVPADSEGRRCGQDNDVKDKPNLFFFDLTKCGKPEVLLDGCSTPQVCVHKCPEKEWTAYFYLNDQLPFDWADIQNHIQCKDDAIRMSINNLERLKEVVDKNLCSYWYIRSRPVYGRCLPTLADIQEAAELLKDVGATEDAVKQSTEIIQALSTVNEVKERVVEDMIHTWRYLVIGLLLAMIISLLYITLLRWLAGVMVWLSLIAITVLLAYAVYVCYNNLQYLNADPSHQLAQESGSVRGRFNRLLNKKSTWVALLVVSGILFVADLLLLVFLRNRIAIAITLIKEGSVAVGSVISSLFFPVFPWFVQCAVVLYAVVVSVFLASVGHNTFKVYGVDNNTNCICSKDYRDGQECTVDTFKSSCHSRGGGECVQAGCHFFQQEADDIITYFHLYNLFAMFWGVWFLSGMAKMILAGTFASWYWTFNKHQVPFFTLTQSGYRTIRYHLGTIAFGSFIIAVCSFIRAIIEFVEMKLKKYDNALTRAIFCILRCFFWCLHKFLCFINTNAYIMCAVRGSNFCSSAQEAFSLLMRNVVRVVVVDKVTDFLFFLGKIVITATMMLGGYYVFSQPTLRQLDNSGEDIRLNYFFVPTLILGVGTYLIASIFFGVYAMAVDTLFLCFLEDCEQNDGSADKPYYMSKRLMKVLGKKNKKNN